MSHSNGKGLHCIGWDIEWERFWERYIHLGALGQVQGTGRSFFVLFVVFSFSLTSLEGYQAESFCINAPSA